MIWEQISKTDTEPSGLSLVERLCGVGKLGRSNLFRPDELLPSFLPLDEDARDLCGPVLAKPYRS
jgi:hypothetical protein